MLSAKNERFTYAYTKQSDFIILDGETGGVTRIHDIADNPTIKWEIYGGKEFAFLRQKNGKTTVIVKEKAIKAIENLDDINVVEREDGWYMESDKGWGLKIPAENYLSVLVGVAGGTIWVGDAQVTIHDVDAMDLNFEAVKEEEKNYIYGEGDKPVGESYHLISESGQTISYREIWYDNSDYDTPQQPIEVIKNGITLDSENYQNTLYANEKGEYLMNPNRLFMISDG